MAKKAASEETQVSEAAFLKSLDRFKTQAKESAKKEKPSGILDDKAILSKLGIEPGDSKTFNGTVSRVLLKFAKNDAKRPMFIFGYIIESDDKRADGTQLSKNIILEEGVDTNGKVFRTLEEAVDTLMFMFQELGEDTSSWKEPMAEAVAAAKRHTKDKTPVQITVKHWESQDKKKHGMNIYVNPGVDGSDLETDDDDEESSDGDFNAEEWIGGWVKFSHDDYGDVRMKVKSYDADSDTFSGVDSNGEKWEDDYAPKVDDVEWDDNQDDE